MHFNNQEHPGTTIRKPSTQYILLNSADRTQFSPDPSDFETSGETEQAWNDFRLQKPETLMNAFAERIQVAEVRFPWFIPNITEYNNKLFIEFNTTTQQPTNQITLTPGFYLPDDIVTAINNALNAIYNPGDVVISYEPVSQKYSIEVSTSTPAEFYLITSEVPNNTYLKDFYTKPSLWKTLGFQAIQNANPLFNNDVLTGLSTQSSYTDYVDIVSDKLMSFTNVRDGTSRSGGQTAVLCRLYANTNVSIATVTPITCSSFIIQRQFSNAKNINWNPDAMIDWIDIKVFDMYNNLVSLPTYEHLFTTTPTTFKGSYPDFQLTLLASET